MKNCTVTVVMFMALSTMTFAAEKFYVAKIRDHEDVETYRVVNQTELQDLTKNEALERKYWSKALSMAQKEWSKKEEYKNKMFPGSCASPVKITPGQPISSQEEAEKKLSRYHDSQMEKLARERDAAKKQRKPKQGVKTSDKKSAGEVAKEVLLADARAMLETHLSGLIQASGAPAAPAAEAPPAGGH